MVQNAPNANSGVRRHAPGGDCGEIKREPASAQERRRFEALA